MTTIRQVTAREFYTFHSEVVRGPWRGMYHVLLDPERLGKQTERIAAEVNGRIVGVAVLAIDGDRGPTLDAVYVLPEFCRKGIGLALTTAALERFRERGISRVFCSVNGRAMRATLDRVPPELRGMVHGIYSDDDLDLPDANDLDLLRELGSDEEKA